MRKLIIICLITCSCSHDPTITDNNSIEGHYWICDSVKTTTSGVSHTDIVGQGLGADIEFHANGTYTVYSNPQIVKNYKISHDTLYFWSPPNPMSYDQYDIIKELANKKMHTWQKDDADHKEFDTYHHYN